MYSRYFGFSENPFALSPDPRYLYQSHRHQEALAHLKFGMNHGAGFVQLTGEVGTGKTLMIRTLLEQLPQNVDVALILYPFLSVREFVAAICQDLRIDVAENASLKTLIDALNAYLLANHAKGRRTVLIIDEAQKLSREVLEQVRLLTNLETTKEKLLQILLIGQPELNALLGQQDLRQLAQRVTARYNLKALSLRETREYVTHRLHVAGATRPLFTSTALRRVHHHAHGVPRLINVLCDRALLGAYALGKAHVNVGMVRRAADEIGRSSTPVNLRSHGATALLGSIVIALAAWHFMPAPERAQAARPASNVAPAPTPSLATLLKEASPNSSDAAYAALLARWQIGMGDAHGDSACDQALRGGLRCMLITGSWNNLRQYNRPAVIELRDAQGDRYHAFVSALNDTDATLEIDGKSHVLSIVEIDRYWLGKSLVLWRPPIAEPILRLGMRGPGVVWLRRALAQVAGVDVGSGEMIVSDVFDSSLETQVKAFQYAHRLPDDGIAGQLTLLRLSQDGPVLSTAMANPMTGS